MAKRCDTYQYAGYTKKVHGELNYLIRTGLRARRNVQQQFYYQYFQFSSGILAAQSLSDSSWVSIRTLRLIGLTQGNPQGAISGSRRGDRRWMRWEEDIRYWTDLLWSDRRGQCMIETNNGRSFFIVPHQCQSDLHTSHYLIRLCETCGWQSRWRTLLLVHQLGRFSGR